VKGRLFLCVVCLLQDAVTICTLGIGTAFGESILDNTPRHATLVSCESSELLRIEQREFKSLWEVRGRGGRERDKGRRGRERERERERERKRLRVREKGRERGRWRERASEKERERGGEGEREGERP